MMVKNQKEARVTVPPYHNALFYVPGKIYRHAQTKSKKRFVTTSCAVEIIAVHRRGYVVFDKRLFLPRQHFG